MCAPDRCDARFGGRLVTDQYRADDVSLAAPAIAAPGTVQRLSARSLVVDPIKRLGTFALPLAAAFVISGHFTVDRAAYYGLAGGLLSIAYSLIRWATFRYALHDNRLDITSGLLARKSRSIPLDRIRGVDLTASPMHRLMRLVVVRVDAAAGGTGRADEGVLDAVTAAEGARLRRLLLARRSAAPAADAEAPEVAQVPGRDDQPRTVLARVRRSWFLMSPLTGAYLFAPLALLGTIWGWVAQSDTIGQRQVQGAAAWLVADPWLVGFAALAFLVLGFPIASVAMTALLNWDFTVRGTPDALELERGLLTRRHVTLERRRLRGWELVEALPARMVRAGRLRALVTGIGAESHHSRAELLPVAPVERAYALAVTTVGARPETLTAHPRAALRRRLFRAIVPWTVLAIAAFATGAPEAGVPLLALALLGIPLGVDRYRSLGHAYDGELVSVRGGSWSRRTVVLQRRAVVGWQVRQTIFQRRQQVATLVVGVGAGSGGYAATDMDADSVATFAHEVTPRWLAPFVSEEATPAEPTR
ncbi:MAG: PH domain-containing protein [Streptosporangiales bacterium]|nr:PH domain-containing protein [Streptosporangiales bacterium]